MMKWVILLSLLTISIAVVPFAFAGDLIVFEDFEDYEAEEDPEGWDTDNTSFMDVVEDPVKNGEKSLKIHCPTDEQDVWIEFGREVQVVSVEFWIFPSTSSRTLSLLMLNGSVARENAGPYLGWGSCQAGFLCRYTGGAWGSTGIRFEDNEWTYVKVVADLTKSPKSYDVYLGEGPDKVPDEPQGKNIPYRSTAMSAFDRVLFLGWGDVAGPGYIDDFLVYEGTERPSGIFSISVESMGKLATEWGAVRNR